jgi:hypothetical protein
MLLFGGVKSLLLFCWVVATAGASYCTKSEAANEGLKVSQPAGKLEIEDKDSRP